MPDVTREGERICLFGGTFDPIHEAHLRIAESARERFHLDRVVFVPAANPPHKEAAGLTPYEDRVRMAELACEPYPAFTVSRIEESDLPSYTVNTLERVRQETGANDKLFFLIGADAFNELETWHRWQDVVKLTEFIVVERPGERYRTPEGAIVHRLDGIALPVSSSSIRERLANGGDTPDVPAAVQQFIRAHGLYGTGKQPTAV